MIRKIIILLIVVINIFAVSLQQITAMSPEQQTIIDSGARYVDIERSCAANTNLTSDKSGLFMVGDSITVGMQQQGLQERLQSSGWNPATVIAEVGRPLGGWGIDTITSNRDAIARSGVVVVALGTNDSVGSSSNGGVIETFQSNVKAAVDIIKEVNPSARIYWVNIAVSRDDIDMQSFNTSLSEAGVEKGFSVIDWGSIGVAQLSGDKIHPTAEGSSSLVDLVTTSIGEAGDTGQIANPGGCTCALPGGGLTSGVDAIQGIPEYWRNLITNAATHYPDVDARLVAATLWIENRGWPDPNKNWGISTAGAKGPWQFIDSSWASMGRDGDGDGIADVNNPADAVMGAFEHQRGSAGLPIAEEYDGNPESSFEKIVFKRDRKNLLSFLASYNGSGAPNNTKLTDFPRNENSNYVIMGYWLLATNFQKTWGDTNNWGVFTNVLDGDGSSGASSCGDKSSGQVVGDFAWPVDKKFWDENQQWFTKPHHTYPASDIPVAEGTPIYSMTNGTVLWTSSSGDCGTGIAINYNGFEFGYCHAITGSVNLQVGDSVTAGQQIMLSGNTGQSSGPHLHLQIINKGVKYCPQELFKKMAAGDMKVNLNELPTSGCVG